ncbi:MAG: long-chain fatty acid--CoA ligase [Caldilineae bacterium]|nr:MAG: long-chain fatty acid--CoA ligase [Caldilineae bacterium]
MSTPQTLSQYWLSQVDRYHGTNKVAVRQKDLGIWQPFTWDQEYEQVRDFCLGLLALGLERHDRVAIIGDNDRQYLWGALGIMAAGATVVGIFTDVTPKEVEYVVNHSDATFVLAGDQEQCDKLLAIKEQVPRVKRVIYWDERGMWHYNDPWLMDFKDVQALGREQGAEADDRFRRIIAQGQGSDIAMFCYTSGTTGLPKGAMITHANFIYQAHAFAEIDPRTENDNFVSFIPLAWIGGAALDIGPHTTHAVILNFTESPETVQQNIREIAPDSLLYNSRLWENLVSVIQVRMIDATWFNRMLYNLFLPVGYRMADHRLQKKRPSLWLRLLYRLGDLLIFTPLLSQFGLHRARSAFTAGAALSPDVVRYFLALGLPLRQIYGSTEVSGGAVAHLADDIKFESVGVPLPGSRVKISPEGEILLTGPGLFAGYHKNPEATEEAIYVDEEGVRWFRTGDAGHIDEDGHLIYLDRVKDMISLGEGDQYSPQYIEGRLKFSPYISHAMTLGDEQKRYVTALITIDFDNVGRWAEKHGLAYTTFTDLSQRPEVYALIRKDVQRVNETLPEAARVRRFVLLHKEFDADEGEMTRTRKLRRRFLADRYSQIIEALYDGRSEIDVTATVEYRDGRVGTIQTTLHIESMDEAA